MAESLVKKLETILVVDDTAMVFEGGLLGNKFPLTDKLKFPPGTTNVTIGDCTLGRRGWSQINK